MRKPIIAGNWKMNKTPQEGAEFAAALKAVPGLLDDTNRADILVIPSFVAIPAVSAVLSGSPIKVGAQNVHEEEDGQYTSGVSAKMLKGLVEYVLVGHSEVRQFLHESDAQINKKVHQLLKHGFKPIIACGETREQRKAGQTDAVVGGQVAAALAGVSAEAAAEIVIAYEPIWSIGKDGEPCPSPEANAVCAMIRGIVAKHYNDSVAQSVRIQYGGSVKPENMKEYMSQPDIDGGLVGGAALKIDSFVSLVRLAIEAKQ